jgi:DNA-binding PadR family transcriptional regulator
MSLNHAILGVLRTGPLHGYGIGEELARRIAGGSYNSGQISQALGSLAARGFIAAVPTESGAGRDRRPYRLTPSGMQEFARWLDNPFIPARPTRDDAVVKIVFLGAEDAGKLTVFLERLRKQHLRRLALYRPPAQGNALPGASLLFELTGAALRFREEAELRWIEHALARLQSLRAPASGEGASVAAREDLAADRPIPPAAGAPPAWRR